MSHVVFASTFGAVFGPLLIAPTAARRRGLVRASTATPDRGCSAPCASRLAMINTAVRLRPDPLVVAGGGGGRGRHDARRSATPSRVIRAAPRARLALASMAVSQATMVAVMTMTPVHMKLHGHETMSPYVISAHIGGMFAFSPLVGRYVDRRGSLSAVQVGAAILVAVDVARLGGGDLRVAAVPGAVGARARAGTSGCSAGRRCSSSPSLRPSESACRERPT